MSVEDHANGVRMGELLIRPTLLLNQGLTHRLGGHAGILKGTLKLRIALAVRLYQRENILQQVRLGLLAWAPTALRIVVDARDSGAQLVQPQRHRLARPTKHCLRLSRTPTEVVQGHLRLELPSFRSSQLARGVTDRFNHRSAQACLGFFRRSWLGWVAWFNYIDNGTPKPRLLPRYFSGVA